ncbi:MAG: ATP-binding protein [Cyanophyceae cyanobacterium]
MCLFGKFSGCCTARLNGRITSDHALLSRVVKELLNNACKYTPSNHSITLKIGEISGGIKLQVINTGVTIPNDKLITIFEKSHRIQQLDIYSQGGT